MAIKLCMGSSREDFDVRDDAATVELMAGEWVDVAKERTQEHRDQDLERPRERLSAHFQLSD